MQHSSASAWPQRWRSSPPPLTAAWSGWPAFQTRLPAAQQLLSSGPLLGFGAASRVSLEDVKGSGVLMWIRCAGKGESWCWKRGFLAMWRGEGRNGGHQQLLYQSCGLRKVEMYAAADFGRLPAEMILGQSLRYHKAINCRLFRTASAILGYHT